MYSRLTDAIQKVQAAGELEAFLHTIREKTTLLLNEHGQQFPDNVALGLNKEGTNIELFSEEEINPLLGITVLEVAEKEIDNFLTRVTVPDRHQKVRAASSKLAEIAFYIVNGLFFIGSIAWVFNILNSSDFRQWYYSELLDVSSVFASLSFSILIPTVLLATVIAFFIKRKNEQHPVTVVDILWKFEVPVLIVLLLVRELVLVMPLTDGLRVLMAVLSWVIVIELFVHRFKLISQSFWSVLVTSIATIISQTIIGYWTLAVLVPMALFVLSEIEIGSIGEIFSLLVYEPFALIFFTLYLVLFLVPYMLTYVVFKQVRDRMREHRDILNSRWKDLVKAIQIAVPVVFLFLLFILSRSTGIGEYAEPLILAAQANNTYDSLQLRALPLIENRTEIEKRFENEMNKYEQYLFRSSDFRGESLIEQYTQLIWFPFIDNKDWNTSNRMALRQGYQKVFGEQYSEGRNNLIELRQVQLRSRDVLVNTLGSNYLANVTITDSYTTFVTRDQEVVLEFSLPEHAVITDLKLGSALQYQGQIAPRGSAQQVYNEQVWRNIDPALLEQVGPRQYRLRVFPVPANTDQARQMRREEVDGDTQRVQFSYTVMRDTEGIPLPVFSQQYNVLTSETDYSYTLNGQPAVTGSNDSHIVEPRTLSALCSSGFQAVASAYLNGFYAYNIGTDNLSAGCTGLAGRNIDVTGQEIVFYLDTSFDTNAADVEAKLRELRSLPESLYEKNNVSLVYFNDLQSAPIPLRSVTDVPSVEDIVFFGGSSLWEIVKTSQADIAIFLTGDVPSNVTNRNNPTTTFDLNNHLAFIHYGEAIPSYRHGTIAQFQSASLKVYDDIDSALKTITLLTDSSSGQLLAVGDYWSISNVSNGTTSASSGQVELTTNEAQALQQIALRAELVNLNQTGRVTPSSLHARAEMSGIVTPLSSYIALVNNQQQARLDELSAQADRFTSETRFTVTQPQVRNPFSSSFGSSLMMGGATGLDDGSLELAQPLGSPGGSVPVFAPTVAGGGTPTDNTGTAKLPLILFFGIIGIAIAVSMYVVVRHRRSAS